MKHVFWLVPGKLGGRPGPDRAPWDLGEMRGAGVEAVLSVNDGLLCHPGDFRAYGIEYACIPLSDNAPPQPGDRERCLLALPLALGFVKEHLAEGRGTVVHCSSGKDRTGLLLTAIGWEEFAVDVLRRVA